MGQYALEFYLPILSYVLLLRIHVFVSVLLLRTYVCVSNSIHDCCSCLSSYLRWDSNLCIPALPLSYKGVESVLWSSVTISIYGTLLSSLNCYHPIASLRNFAKSGLGTGLVSMSAGCSNPAILTTVMLPSSTYCRKWCNLMFMCFVRGRYLLFFAISIAPALSS